MKWIRVGTGGVMLSIMIMLELETIKSTRGAKMDIIDLFYLILIKLSLILTLFIIFILILSINFQL
jgi:hypothetical protein